MARLIALYLPQFHQIPENDRWWGKGFTEWTNVRKAKPLFRGHEQPRIPGDMGYYDLLDPDVRSFQAELASEAGIEGFCYYHYWFGRGKELLEKPLQQVVESGKPDFPFCLCWANHSWSNKTWEKSSAMVKEKVLMRQRYGGDEDYREHFYRLLPTFRDKRYIWVDGRLLFFLYDCYHFKDVRRWMEVWRELAVKEGLPGFYFVGMTPATLTYRINKKGKEEKCMPNLESSSEIYKYILSLGFDAVNSLGQRRGEMLAIGKIKSLVNRVLVRLHLAPSLNFDYEKVTKGFFAPEDRWENVFPTVMPDWDRSPRVGKAEGIYLKSTPKKWEAHLRDALALVRHKKQEHQIIVIKSWNEWAEGNYLEPDKRYGCGYLNAIRRALTTILLFLMPLATMAKRDNATLLARAQELGMPIVWINTTTGENPTCEAIYPPEGCDGVSITNNEKLTGSMYITIGNDTLYRSGPYVEDQSGITIRVRGNTTAANQNKFPYKVKLQKKADLLMRGNDDIYKDKDWVLLKSCWYESLAGKYANRAIGMPWVPENQLVWVVLNGDFRGQYLLSESIKRNPKCRIDVSELGYIFEYDPYWWNEDYYIPSSVYRYNYTLKYPDATDITPEQENYLIRLIDSLEAETRADTVTSGLIDLKSFARWLMVHDILGDRDYAGSNMYFEKYDTLETPIRMSVPWDFGGCFTASRTEDWAAVHTRWWFAPLFEQADSALAGHYCKLFDQVGLQTIDYVIDQLDSLRQYPQIEELDTAVVLDNECWWPEFQPASVQLGEMIAFLTDHRTWMQEAVEAIRPSHLPEDSVEPEEPKEPEEPGESALPSVWQNMREGEVRYYDVMGRPLPGPQHGVTIRVTRKGITKLIIP